MMHFIRLFLPVLFLINNLNLMAQEGPKASSMKPANDDKLVWMDWNTGYEKAIKTGKIVLVDAYTDWCGWCKRMDRDTYSQPLVIQKINAHFIPIKFNPEIPDKLYKVADQTYTP